MPLDLSRIRALCFDVDGTLSDTDDQMTYTLARRLTPIQWLFPSRDPHPFARWCIMGLESPGNFVYGALDWLGLDSHLENLKKGISNQLARRGWGLRPPTFWLIPQALQTLERLNRLYPMAIVSARDPGGTQAFLKQFQLHPFFHAVAHAQTCRHTKPFPDPILWAAREMGVAPEACLMIGDTSVDILAGKAAGAQTVGVLCGFGHEIELRRAGADLILPATNDLLAVLEG
jgi:phosphoglycolate phosphatase-like HAD superfamily hydrolase